MEIHVILSWTYSQDIISHRNKVKQNLFPYYLMFQQNNAK
jgi:hypothetical protein